MANVNKGHWIGRLTRDPESKTFQGGGKVCRFGLAFASGRKKNQQTGKWEDEPCFVDCEVWNHGEKNRNADNAEQYLSKGKQVYIEGHLKMDAWTASDGSKRNKILIVVDHFQFLDGPRQEPATRQEQASDETFAPAGEEIPF